MQEMLQMKTTLGLFVVILLANLSAGHAGIPGNMGMDHVGFVVPNAQEAVDFLITLFDCEFDWEVKRDPTPTAGERGWSKIFDIHTESYMPHVVMLKCGDHFLTQYIEVFEWYSPDQYKPPHNGWLKMTDIGWGYFSFTVKDVFAVVDHIKRANIPGVRIIQDPPMAFPLRGELCTSTFMVTPWGQWIELTQWSISGPQGSVIKKLTDIVTMDTTEGCKKNIYSPNHLELGKKVEELETPALIVDLNAFEHNIELMYSRVTAKGMTWIPAVKAHKSPGLSKKILAAGGQGVLLLKISEVEAFIKADKDIDDIYLANEVIDPEKIGKLVRAARQLRRLRVNVDDEQNIRDIALRAHQANTVIEMMVEVDIGHHRCGVTPQEAVELAKVVYELEKTVGSVRFAGITGYEGHTPVLPPDEKTKETFACHAILAEAKRLIESEGLVVNIVSGGGSSNYIDALNTGVLTELQAGGGALTDNLYYNKANLKDHGHQVGFFVLTQIMSVPKDQSRAMADAGHKALGWHPFGGLAQPFGRDDIEVYGLSAEHTKIRAKLPEGATEQERPPVPLKRGDKILLVPGYGDSMGFMHQQIYAVRNGIVEDVWPIVAANQIQ